MAIDNGHTEVARWLYNNISTERNGLKAHGAIEAALMRNDMALAKSLVPQGQDIMTAPIYCTGNVEIVEHIVDSGYLRTRSCCGVMIIRALVGSGRLDLMQRVANLRYSPRRDDTQWADVWRDVLKDVCYGGDCAMVQWVTGHPMGRQACKLLQRDDQLSQLLWRAVAGGNSVEVMQSLKAYGFVHKYGPALVEAVAKNDMKSIEWLLNNFPQSEHLPDYCVLNEAAKWGHLHLLKYFQSLPSVPGFVPCSSQTQQDEKGGAPWSFSPYTTTNMAFEDSYRNVQGDKQWQRFCWNSTDAMDNAAANGHLETVQWLYANRTEGCTPRAMDFAAAHGHLKTGCMPTERKAAHLLRWIVLLRMTTCMWCSGFMPIELKV